MKTLAVISLTAFVYCCGVQSAEPLSLEQQIFNSGTVVFLDFLEKARSATEKFIRDEQFKKSRITFQGYVKALRGFAKSLKDPDSAGGRQDHSDIPLERFFSAAFVTLRQMTKDVTDRFLLPYVNMYRETLKKETIMDIWKEVDTHYLPGAPPVNSKPMEFLSYLLAKVVVRSQMVNMVQVGVDSLEVIGQIDFNQLNEKVKVAIHQIRNKASEISDSEKQKEKNKILVSLRTILGLVVFYWDKVLEQIESPSFQEKFEDSYMKLYELIQFRDNGEKINVLLSQETWDEFARRFEDNYGFHIKAVFQVYLELGVQILGHKRCFQSIRTIGTSAFVISLPVCEKLSKVGFGLTELNRFLNRAEDMTRIFLECIQSSESLTPLKDFIILIILSAYKTIEEEKQAQNFPLSLPLWTCFPVAWKTLLAVEKNSYTDKTETELKQMESEWNDAKRIIINELVKSGVFTRQQLEDVPDNFVRHILGQLKQHANLGDDELIDSTIVAFKRLIHRTNMMLREFWDLLLE